MHLDSRLTTINLLKRTTTKTISILFGACVCFVFRVFEMMATRCRMPIEKKYHIHNKMTQFSCKTAHFHREFHEK